MVGARTNPTGSAYLVHYTETDRRRWDLHSPESYKEMKEPLDGLEGTELSEYEVMCGMKRNPNGLLWGYHLRGILNMPYAVY